jgi:hypothetical protein
MNVKDLFQGRGEAMPLVSDIPAVQAHYEHCRLEGCTHRLAEMFAWQQPPSVMSDSVFMEGRCNGNQFEDAPWIGNIYQAEAKAAGVDTKGAHYLHGLAAYPGDPKAWVRSRGDVQRVCEERGWGCQGAVNVKPRAHDPKADTPVAADIVEAEVMAAVERDPELARKPAGELAHEATEKLRPAWTRKKTPRKRTVELD